MLLLLTLGSNLSHEPVVKLQLLFKVAGKVFLSKYKIIVLESNHNNKECFVFLWCVSNLDCIMSCHVNASAD